MFDLYHTWHIRSVHLGFCRECGGEPVVEESHLFQDICYFILKYLLLEL